jgi:hypothetical protein
VAAAAVDKRNMARQRSFPAGGPQSPEHEPPKQVPLVDESNGGQPSRLAPWIKVLVSGLILLHLAAVFVAPFQFASTVGGSSSPFADALRSCLRPYIEALYLNHGYFFFAPNPGPNHLIEYRVEYADGREATIGRIPNLMTERPRLLYHRHFMVAEALNNAYAPPEPQPEPSPPSLTASDEERQRYAYERGLYQAYLANWQRQRAQYEAMKQSIEDHLTHEFGATSVKIARIEHRQPVPDDFTAGRRLTDKDSYVEMPEVPPRGESR